jgi:uncharacterized protein YbjT (DUF2867 family)
MNVLVFGATGMIGQGAILACLASPDVESVTAIGRRKVNLEHTKLRNIVHADMWNYSTIEDKLTGFDACFFCLGVTSAGLKEPAYSYLTYDLTLTAATTLAKLNPELSFIYVSGAGTDSSEQGNSMWARVKGRTENSLLALPMKQAFMFRPGVILPLDGIRSKTKFYQALYSIMSPILSILRKVMPNYIATTRTVANAMIRVCKEGYSTSILNSTDIELLTI